MITETPKTTLFIAGEVPSQKNSKRIIYNRNTNSRLVISSKATMEYINKSDMQYAAFADMFRKGLKDKEFPVRIEFTLIRKSKARFDYINILQVVCDQMVKHKWIPDDSMAYLIPVIGLYKIDKACPGVKITIL